MVDSVIGSTRSERIRHELSELAMGIRRMRLGNSDHVVLSYDDRLSTVCEDSLWLEDFMMSIEDEYDIIINMKETVELETISDLVELIESKKL